MGTTKELSGLKLGLGCDNKVQLSWMQGQQTEGDKRTPFTGKDRGDAGIWAAWSSLYLRGWLPYRTLLTSPQPGLIRGKGRKMMGFTGKRSGSGVRHKPVVEDHVV